MASRRGSELVSSLVGSEVRVKALAGSNPVPSAQILGCRLDGCSRNPRVGHVRTRTSLW